MHELQRVLFVEDQLAILQIIELALAMVGGLEAHGFTSGRDAIACASSVRPQLLLLDVMMPDLDGPTTLGHLRGITGLETVPVVFLTAKVDSLQVERLHSLGAAAVLFKPFDPMTLADQLRKIWSASLVSPRHV
jgi:two-component system, OmpR family, response regulator